MVPSSPLATMSRSAPHRRPEAAVMSDGEHDAGLAAGVEHLRGIGRGGAPAAFRRTPACAAAARRRSPAPDAANAASPAARRRWRDRRARRRNRRSGRDRVRRKNSRARADVGFDRARRSSAGRGRSPASTRLRPQRPSPTIARADWLHGANPPAISLRCRRLRIRRPADDFAADEGAEFGRRHASKRSRRHWPAFAWSPASTGLFRSQRRAC